MERNSIKKVYVCFDGDKFTKEMITEDLKGEGYIYNFNINTGNPVAVELCDEFWVFGNCATDPMYLLAVKLGKDIWRMG